VRGRRRRTGSHRLDQLPVALSLDPALASEPSRGVSRGMKKNRPKLTRPTTYHISTTIHTIRRSVAPIVARSARSQNTSFGREKVGQIRCVLPVKLSGAALGIVSLFSAFATVSPFPVYLFKPSWPLLHPTRPGSPCYRICYRTPCICPIADGMNGREPPPYTAPEQGKRD